MAQDSAPDDADTVPGRHVDVAAYLDRLGVDAAADTDPDRGTLARLQRAHVTTVPFENLGIVGDPHGDHAGPGVDLSQPALFEKVVHRERGGYCFELNGLFHALLAALGYDVHRVAARVDGALTVPANHHVNVVTLDQPYVVDVGTGAPMIRQPLPLDGTAVTDELGIEWRVTDSGRPDETHEVAYREPGDDWTTRYVFTPTPVDLDYFRATNDYLQTAPESSFTGDPAIQIATADGHRKLTADALTDPLSDDDGRPVPPDEWHDVLRAEFGITLPDA